MSLASARVSVIVPIYNVAEYLAECLESLACQTLDGLEVILVDDGSTDGSGAIARSFADAHENARYFRIPNGGVGAARAYGVAQATGEYLCFCDADDVVPAQGYEKLYRLARESDGDLVVGDMLRFDSAGEHQSALHRKAYLGAPSLMSLQDNPSLIYDTTSMNKLFRRSFYDECGLSWPDISMGEDIPFSVSAMYSAGAIPHLGEAIYKWRYREGGNASATQKKYELGNLRDRFTAMRMLDDYFAENVHDARLALAKDIKWLDWDIRLYMKELPKADVRFQRLFMELASEFVGRMEPKALESVRAIDRIKYCYVMRHDLDALLRVLRYEQTGYKAIRIRRTTEGRYMGGFPFTDVPGELFDMTDELAERDLRTSVRSVRIEGDELQIAGEAWISRLSIRHKEDVACAASVVRDDGAFAYTAYMETLSSRRRAWFVNIKYRTARHEVQKFRGYRLTIPLAVLAALDAGCYFVRVEYALCGLACVPTRLKQLKKDTGKIQPTCSAQVGAASIDVAYTPYGELAIHIA